MQMYRWSDAVAVHFSTEQRLRKVKCVRSAVNNECNSCISKNIACTLIFSQSHAYGKGKRIEQAREQFGTKVALPEELTSSSSSRSISPLFTVQSAATHKINEQVLSAKALSAFLHAYETDVASAIPTLEVGISSQGHDYITI